MDLHEWIAADLASVRGKLFDSVAALVPQERWHEQADAGGVTIAGLLLHIARHQDLAVHVAVRNHEPLFAVHRHLLGLGDRTTGVGLSEAEDRDATTLVPADALLRYVEAVFDSTAAWLEHLGTLVLESVPDTTRHLTERAGITVDEFPWLHRMWGGQPIWWFVQWPVVGHANAHVGEGISIRNRMGLSPF
jgi:hypothetical protein